MIVRRTRIRQEAVANTPVNSITARRQAIKQAKAGPVAGSDPDSAQMVVRISNDPFAMAIDKAPAIIQPTREGHYLHVSDLLSKCIRKRCVSLSLGTQTAARRLSLSDVLTFAQGDAIHDTLKETARRGSPRQVWGKWSCKCKFLFHEEPCTYGEIDQEETCPHCHTLVDQYHEVSMFDEEHWIVGNPDMLQYIHSIQAFHITEIKSISPDQYKDLSRPKPEHVLQVIFYWWLMHRLGYRLTSHVTIFYATKGWVFGGTKPYKSFSIDVQHELHRLDDMLEDAKAHKASVLSIQSAATAKKVKVIFPPRTHCATKTTKDAKSCDVCDICFEMN